MKTFVRILILAGLVLTLFSFISITQMNAQATINETDATGSISGRVTDEQGVPLVGIEVTLYSSQSSSSNIAHTTTNRYGIYQFRYLKTDAYRILYKDFPRVISEYYGDAVSLDDASPISVAGNAVSDINAKLQYAGSISGKVSSAYGYLLAPLSFSVYQNGNSVSSEKYELSYEAGGSVGNYQILGLPAGDYQLLIEGTLANQRQREYFDDAFSLESSSLISVQAQETTTGIDFVLDQNRATGTISGKVTTIENHPLSGIDVELINRNSSSQTQEYRQPVETDQNGNYRLLFVSPGSYTLHFSDRNTNFSRSYYGGASYQDATVISVTAASENELLAQQLKPSGTIFGDIKMANGEVPESGSIELYSDANQFQTAIDQETFDQWPTNRTFSFRGLAPGTYLLLAAATYRDVTYTEYYTAALTVESAQPITITESALNTSVAMILGLPPIYGMVTGFVTDEANSPLNEFEVTAYQSVNSTWQAKRTVKTDSNGKYSLIALNPGSYRFCIKSPTTFYLDECYKNSNLDNAQTTEINAGQNLTDVNVSLSQTGGVAGTLWFMPDVHYNKATFKVYQKSGKSWQFAETMELELSNVYNNHFDYLIGGLQSGVYRVKVYATRYEQPDFEQYFGGGATIATGKDITVTYGQKTTKIDFQMGEDPLNAHIEGTIRNNLVPVSEIEVELYHIADSYSTQWEQWVTVTSDEAGYYKLDGLPAGNYRLAFVDPKGQQATIYYGAPSPHSGYKPTIADAQTLQLVNKDSKIEIDVDMGTGYQGPPLRNNT
ncbi:MAG: carboxypeptidase regulatory-like domain-containing protein [Caldilineaceae bacterium]